MDEQLNDVEIEKALEDTPEIIYEGDEGYEQAPEEAVEAASDEESEEIEEAPSEEKPKKPRIPAKTRINQMSKKYHSEARRAEKAEIELAKMREENERLRRISENQSKSVLSSQESIITGSIMHAKQMKAKAMEDGDIEGQINADEALAAAVADKRRLEEYKYQQKLMEEQSAQYEQSPKASQYQEEYEEHEATPEAREWVAENPWFNGDSDEFDPDLHQKAYAYSQFLDRSYQKKGRENLIGSYEYFDDLNRYMERHIRPQATKSVNQGGLRMNKPTGAVAGVGRSAPQGGQREQFRMSREEQNMARAMGWTDQEWFQNKKLADRYEKDGRLTTSYSRTS